MSTSIRKVIYKAGHNPISRISLRSHRVESGKEEDEISLPGHQLASMLGVRAVYEVDENEFFRDKLMQVTTFGLSGKRGISQGPNYNLAETQVGSQWKTRILMITMSSIVLFSYNKKSLAGSKAAGTSSSASQTSGEGDELKDMNGSGRTFAQDDEYAQLINHAEELKTTISMEDVNFCAQFEDPKGSKDWMIQIRATTVTGHIRVVLIRVKQEEKFLHLMRTLESALKAYRTALDALRKGLVADDPEDLSAFHPSMISILDGVDGTEVIVSRSIHWKEDLRVENVKASSMIEIYLTGLGGKVYLASLRPFHMKIAADMTEAATSGDSEDQQVPVVLAEILPSSDMKSPLSLYFYVSGLKAKGLLTFESIEENTDGEERVLEIAVKETHVVFFVCFVVITSILLPDWCFERKFVLTALTIPIGFLMLYIRGKQGFRPILNKVSHELEQKHTTKEDSNEMLSFTITLLNAKEGTDPMVMQTNQTEDEYRRSLKQRQSAFAAAEAFGGASTRQLRAPPEENPEEKGINDLLHALSGAHDTTLTDADCPQKWFDATDGDEKDAIRQWKESLEWRREFEVDTVLSKPQEHFFEIKNRIPHCWFGIDKEGHLVTLEKFSTVKSDVHKLKQIGITPEKFAAHAVFLNEFWIKNKLTKTGRLNKILDLQGFGVSQLTREVISYFQPMNHAMQQYPELIIKVFIINAPTSFRFAWRIVSPFLAKKTTEKIKFPSGNDKVLKELLGTMIPAEILPLEYGGTFGGEFKDMEFEREVAAYIRQLNRINSVPSPEDWDPGAPPSTLFEALPEKVKVLEPDGSEMAGNARKEVEGEHAVDNIDLLVGDWQGIPSESDSMDPVLELQGVSYIKRRAASMLTPNQSIQITGIGKSRTIEIVTRTGPITNSASGVLDSGEVGQAGMTGVKGVAGMSSVTARTCPAPEFLQDVTVPRVVELEFTLPNNDRRIVQHGVSKQDRNKKIMAITYVREKDCKSATVKIVSRRKVDRDIAVVPEN